MNRNKRAMTLDPSCPEGRAIVRKLVATADVVVANLPPEVFRSLSLDLERMASGALGVFPDRERADDQVVEHDGAAVLLVGRDIVEKVKDTSIDYEESGTGPGLVIKRN